VNRRLDQFLNALTHSGPGYRTSADPARIQQDVAFRIRAELVCCNIYERVNDLKELTLKSAQASQDWHDLCYWGEASARIAEGRCPGYETEPNICRCLCEGCKHNCSAHKEGSDG